MAAKRSSGTKRPKRSPPPPQPRFASSDGSDSDDPEEFITDYSPAAAAAAAKIKAPPAKKIHQSPAMAAKRSSGTKGPKRPKRFPPPPQPRFVSSDGSDSDDQDEFITDYLPAAVAPKIKAPPAKKIHQSESSDNDQEDPRDFDKMCELYPYLGDRVKELEKLYPGLHLERRFCIISDEKASALDAKLEKHWKMLIKLDQDLLELLD